MEGVTFAIAAIELGLVGLGEIADQGAYPIRIGQGKDRMGGETLDPRESLEHFTIRLPLPVSLPGLTEVGQARLRSSRAMTAEWVPT